MAACKPVLLAASTFRVGVARDATNYQAEVPFMQVGAASLAQASGRVQSCPKMPPPP